MKKKKDAEMNSRMNRAEMGVATPTSFQNKNPILNFSVILKLEI